MAAVAAAATLACSAAMPISAFAAETIEYPVDENGGTGEMTVEYTNDDIAFYVAIPSKVTLQKTDEIYQFPEATFDISVCGAVEPGATVEVSLRDYGQTYITGTNTEVKLYLDFKDRTDNSGCVKFVPGSDGSFELGITTGCITKEGCLYSYMAENPNTGTGIADAPNLPLDTYTGTVTFNFDYIAPTA